MASRNWDQSGGDAVAIIKTIPKVALILIFMPILLFAIVLWMPVRKLLA
jgi:hypothetical protein